jgi:hypothetical protein
MINFARKFQLSIMNEAIDRFLEMPLWLSIPLTLIYLGVCGYFAYILFRYRRE